MRKRHSLYHRFCSPSRAYPTNSAELALKGGVVRTAIHDDGMIETWLPEPQFQHDAVPFTHEDAGDPLGHCVVLQTQYGEFQIIPVSMGNPHGIVFVDDVIGLDVAAIGHELSHHDAFPERANIGFCQIVNKGFIRLRVFERGASETLACGSGASAAVAAGCRTNQLNSKVKYPYRVEASGGMALRQRTDQTRR